MGAVSIALSPALTLVRHSIRVAFLFVSKRVSERRMPMHASAIPAFGTQAPVAAKIFAWVLRIRTGTARSLCRHVCPAYLAQLRLCRRRDGLASAFFERCRRQKSSRSYRRRCVTARSNNKFGGERFSHQHDCYCRHGCTASGVQSFYWSSDC